MGYDSQLPKIVSEQISISYCLLFSLRLQPKHICISGLEHCMELIAVLQLCQG